MVTKAKQFPQGPSSYNEEFFDALVRHQIGLLRLSGTIRNELWEILDATEKDLIAKIRRGKKHGFESPTQVKRAESMIKALKATRAKAWSEITPTWVQHAQELAAAEPEHVQRITKAAFPVELGTLLPQPALLKAVVDSRPFEGKVLRHWANNAKRADLDRIEQAVRIGIVQGESNQAIARRTFGTLKQSGRDGVTQLTRNNIAAITRTMVNHVGTRARSEFYKENSDVFQKEQYTATLDARTTPQCSALDGKIFAVADGPHPPIHYMCRSIRVPFVSPDIIGDRPVRNFTERDLLRDFTGKPKGQAPTSRNDLPFGQKGKFDAFARTEMRKRTGRAPASTDYQSFLSRQTKEVQDDILGDAKGQLFRKGGLNVDKFADIRGSNPTFKPFTLDELRTMHPDAWKKAFGE
jgi:SPP1 gp7 family putative phage head morphogenesis protein